jgi:ribosomal protein S18 acetylase RimI-like enzyme
MLQKLMLLRPYSASDADAVNAIALAAFAQYRGVYSDWDVLERGVGSMTSLADTGEIIVAEADGVIAGGIGYIGPGVSPRADFFEPEWPIIRMLVVDPSARGRGLGRALTEACLQLARRDAAEVVALHTSPAMEVALALYVRMGFKLHQRVPDRFGVPYAVYIKPLGEDAP